MLAPLLEKLTDEYGGRFTLVKANTDETPQAGQFGVQGIPAVFAVLDGEVIDSFQGVLPEESIREWLDNLFKLSELSDARRLIASDPAAAESKLRGILADAPHDSAASIALADLLLQQHQREEATAIIEQLEQRGFLEPEGEKIKAALDLQQKSEIDIDAVRTAASAAPDDLELQLELAQALAGQQEYEAAFEICLSLVGRDRKHTGEKARELMVEVFRVLPDDSELTSNYRRKLSMALY